MYHKGVIHHKGVITHPSEGVMYHKGVMHHTPSEGGGLFNSQYGFSRCAVF